MKTAILLWQECITSKFLLIALIETQWAKTVIDEDYPVDAFDFFNPYSQGSPGIFDIGDLDGNGTPDIMLPGDGANNLYVLVNTGTMGAPSFTRELVDMGTMFGMAKIVDIDNDGMDEVVATMHNAPEDFAGAINPPPGFFEDLPPYNH